MQTADFTIADVLAWARTKPAGRRYNYQACDKCALSQFLQETGRAACPDVLVDDWADWPKITPRMPHPISADLAAALRPKSHYRGTFGSLVRRLEQAVQS